MTEQENGQGSKEIFKRTVKGGRRTYFVRVKESQNNHKFITLTESKLIGDGKFDRFNIMVFPDKLAELLGVLQEAQAVATA